jgi:hypothetical protein
MPVVIPATIGMPSWERYMGSVQTAGQKGDAKFLALIVVRIFYLFFRTF